MIQRRDIRKFFFIISLCWVFMCLNLIAMSQEVLTPEKIIRMKRISDIQISPDGKRIAYVVRSLDEKKHRYTSDIFVVDVETGQSVQMTYHPENDTLPRWSPCGSKLAFRTDRGEKAQIYIIHTDGGESYPLFELKNGISGDFAWSPDGKQIAFFTLRDLTDEEKKARDEKRDEIVFEETMRLNQLALIDIKSKEIKRLTDGSDYVASVSWSPDGKKIAFTSRPSMDVDDYFLSKIYMISSEGGKPQRLTNTKKMREMNPVWSPDGENVAFSGHPGYDQWADPGDVYYVPAVGGTPINLTQKLDRSESVMCWSADSQSIIFSFGNKTSTEMGRINLKNGQIDQQGPVGKVISGVSFSSKNDLLALILTDPMNPPDIWIGESDWKNPRALVRSNPWINQLRLGKTEIVRWKSFDNMIIEGLLVYPVDYKPGKSIPLIVEPHGGPQGVRTVSFSATWQMFAGSGYGVLAPNFRGSGSYGRKFVRANIGDWGGGDYKDIMAGVDHLIQKGIADKNRLGIEGWSYGGYMTNWVIKHTDRFKAAVSGAGLSNLESFYGTTDIQGFMEYYHKGFPWRSREIYKQSSPLASPFRTTTPTLILHGEEDRRVPISQSEEIYHYLKKIDAKVKFVRYPREPHGLGEPNHQLDRYTRMLKWFQYYIPVTK